MCFLNEAGDEEIKEKPELDNDPEEDAEEEEAEEEPDEENGEEGEGESGSEGDGDEEAGSEGDGDEGDDEGGDDGDNDGSDKTKDKAPGYFITYEMSVPGVKEQSLDKSIKKSAFSLFDDIKITPAGIFGSGSSFTVKDIKKSVKNLLGLGGVDPNKLTADISKNFNSQFPDNEIGSSDIIVKDRKTLLKKYGGTLNGKDRQRVEKSQYSILIKIPASNDAQEFINKKVVAAIITKSIKGVVKKFKHGVEPEDVIMI